MMPLFPSPSLKFRTVSFPQSGFKAGISDAAFPVPWFAIALRAFGHDRGVPALSRGSMRFPAPPCEVAVGTEITRCPPHRPVLALLTHTVLTSDVGVLGVEARIRVGMQNLAGRDWPASVKSPRLADYLPSSRSTVPAPGRPHSAISESGGPRVDLRSDVPQTGPANYAGARAENRS